MGGTVRDSIIISSVVLVLSGGFFVLKKSLTTTHQSTPQKTAKNHSLIKTGEIKHESTNHRRDEQKRASGTRTRITGEAPEIDKLPDLYETEEQSERLSLVEDGSEDLASSEQTQAVPSVIAGVPVAAWVKANQHRLKEAEVTGPTQQNLRLFLGCLELKKGAAAVEKYTCEKLLASKDQKLWIERERY